MSARPAAPHAAFLLDASGRITSWNRDCEQLFGQVASAVLERPLAELLTAAARAQCLAHWPRLPQQPDSLLLEVAGAHGPLQARLTLLPQCGGPGQFGSWVALLTPEAGPDLSEAALVGREPLSAVVNVFAGTFYVINRDGRFLLWNKHLERVAGLTPEELATAHALDMFGGAERALMAEKMRQVFEDDAEVVVEANYLDKSGKATPYLLCGARIECRGQYYLCGMGLDISRRREQEEQLRLRERALHATANGIVIARCAGKNNPIDYVNPAFERISGYRADEVLGRDARFMAAPGLDDNERVQLRDAIAERRELNVVFRNLRKDGELFWNDLTITPVLDEHGTVSHFIGVLNDVTASKQRTAHLEHEVNHDALTGLANRTLLWDRLEQALHMAQRNKTLVATVLIDLNDFKLINDSFGHDAGDEVLTVVAKRLLAAVRDSDTVARLSGDEFVLVLVNQPSLRYTLRMVERLRLAMSKPVAFDSREIPVGASMGVSVYPHDGAAVFDLVRAADVAMYHAKATGKSDVHFFSPDMKSSTEAREKLESRMRSAIDGDEIFLLFQPRQCLRTGKVSGIEALLRWRHPEHGVLLPASFLPEAEENGLIIPFGERVLDLVCGFMRQWRAGGHPELVVSMNASYREFSQHNFVARIGDQLGKYGLPCQWLELELKEEALLRNPHLGREIAGQLRESGMKLSIDAFGDGNTSLSFLQKLPLTHLKMARSSVREINPESRAGPLVKAMIDIAHDLDLCVVAEGVETRSQLDFLKSHGCDEMQGSYFSAPLEAGALERFIRSAA